jgi:hypothetical protein
MHSSISKSTSKKKPINSKLSIYIIYANQNGTRKLIV